MIGQGGLGWQTVIADLALILFLVTAGATRQDVELGKSSPRDNPALSRWESRGNEPPLDRWLDEQPSDARTTVVLVGRYAEGDRERVWNEAANNELVARQRYDRVRTIVVPARKTEWSARLVYDGQPMQ